MSTKIRNKIQCNCKVCDGKYVEERTRKRHIELERRLASSVSGFVPFLPGNNRDEPAHTALEIGNSPIAEGSSSSKKKAEQEESTSFDSNYESDFAIFVPQKRRRQDQFREPEVNQYENPSEDESNKPIDEYECDSDIPSEDDYMVLSDDEIPVEQFTAPDNDSEFKYPDTNVNFADSWILIWIFKYQTRFRLSDVAIDSLIKFFQQVLLDADQRRFKNFPSSLYTASNLLQIGNQSKTYAVCPSCNTLYNTAEVVVAEGFKCTHVKFPMRSKVKSCGTELTVQVPLANEIKRRPKLLFPLPNLRLQINSLYQRSEFKQQL